MAKSIRDDKWAQDDEQGFPMLAKRGLQRAASPVPEREVSSHPPLLPTAAGGKRRSGKPWGDE